MSWHAVPCGAYTSALHFTHSCTICAAITESPHPPTIIHLPTYMRWWHLHPHCFRVIFCCCFFHLAFSIFFCLPLPFPTPSIAEVLAFDPAAGSDICTPSPVRQCQFNFVYSFEWPRHDIWLVAFKPLSWPTNWSPERQLTLLLLSSIPWGAGPSLGVCGPVSMCICIHVVLLVCWFVAFSDLTTVASCGMVILWWMFSFHICKICFDNWIFLQIILHLFFPSSGQTIYFFEASIWGKG